MRPFWHPLSAVLLPDPPMFAAPGVVRMLLARGPVELLYAGDRMRPSIRHGQHVVVERPGGQPIRPGEVVLAAPTGVPDLLRVGRVDSGQVFLAADADPGTKARAATAEVLGRARLPLARSSALQRTLRRLALDLREVFEGRPDEAGDPAATVRGKYEAQAPFYSTLSVPDLEAPLLARIRRHVPAGGRILVAGSGTGRECFALAGEGWEVVGVDFAPAMVEAARRQASRRGLDVEFHAADLRTHEEGEGSLAAVVFTYDVYSFVPSRRDRIELLRRMLRWLSPEGVVFLSARRVGSAWERLCLTIQRAVAKRPDSSWGASHTRWLAQDGSLHRSFIHVFTDRALERELDGAGAAPENWEGGHVLVRRRGAAAAVGERKGEGRSGVKDDRQTSRGGTYAMRRGSPPPMDFFAAARPAAGSRGIRVRLGEIRIDLTGLDERRAGELLRRYAPYSSEAPGPEPGALRVAVGLEDREYFLAPPERPEFNPVFLAVDGDRVRYLGYKVAGWFDARGGSGRLLLTRGNYEPDVRSFENYVRAAVAWRAATLGGALIHAASAVRNGKAYLFYGESGAGKSTLAASTRRATIVSDDLSLVLPGPHGLVLVGSPFRGTYEGGDPVQGSFPVAAGFRLIQAAAPEVRDVARPRAMSELVGNLPFVAEAFARRGDLFAAIERAFAPIPLGHLHFCKDDSYWEAIDRAGL